MLVIHADWDSEAGCWYATSDDIPGLATGEDTVEDLIERLKVIVPELVELNDVPVDGHVCLAFEEPRCEPKPVQVAVAPSSARYAARPSVGPESARMRFTNEPCCAERPAA